MPKPNSSGNTGPSAAELPPHNLEAEMACLGAMMLEKEAIAEAIGLLQAEDFYRENNRLVFSAIITLYEKGKPADLITLGEELRERGQLEPIGGTAYLTACLDSCPTAAAIRHYAEIVAEKSRLRSVLHFSQIVARHSTLPDASSSEVLASVQSSLANILSLLPEKKFISRSLNEILSEPLAPPPWVVKPFLASEAVTMLHGREGTSKSFLALHIALAVAAGREVFGRYRVSQPGPVLYWDSDNPHFVMERRARALYDGMGLNGAFPLAIARDLPLAINEPESYLQVKNTIQHLQAVLFVVDIFSDSHTSPNENDNSLMRPVMQAYRNLAKECGCAIFLVHHDRKSMQGIPADLVRDSARGCTTIFGKLDLQFAIRVVEKQIRLHQVKNRITGENEPLFAVSIEGSADKNEPVKISFLDYGTKFLSISEQIEEHIIAALEQAEGEELSYSSLASLVVAELKYSERSLWTVLGGLLANKKITKRKEGQRSFYSLRPV